jgi:hypothetical protein
LGPSGIYQDVAGLDPPGHFFPYLEPFYATSPAISAARFKPSVGSKPRAVRGALKRRRCQQRMAMAFSSEVDTGWPEENASKPKARVRF